MMIMVIDFDYSCVEEVQSMPVLSDTSAANVALAHGPQKRVEGLAKCLVEGIVILRSGREIHAQFLGFAPAAERAGRAPPRKDKDRWTTPVRHPCCVTARARPSSSKPNPQHAPVRPLDQCSDQCSERSAEHGTTCTNGSTVFTHRTLMT